MMQPSAVCADRFANAAEKLAQSIVPAIDAGTESVGSWEEVDKFFIPSKNNNYNKNIIF
jgi:hypothetical protein